MDPSFVCCGVRIDAVTLNAAVARVLHYAKEDHGRAVHLCNAYTLSLARRDSTFAAVLNCGDLNLADGMPLVWAGRRLGFPEMSGRAYGPDVLRLVADRGRMLGVRHYFYGSRPGVAQRMADRLEEWFPGMITVGTESPPFRDLRRTEEAEMIDRIRSSGADVVWVGLGTPRQDEFVDRYAAALSTPLVAVGAAFDFYAGDQRQAPVWMREVGLEWAFRLATEPRRLWRRYLFGNIGFLAGAARDLTTSRRVSGSA